MFDAGRPPEDGWVVVDLASSNGTYLIDPSWNPFDPHVPALIQDGDKSTWGPGPLAIHAATAAQSANRTGSLNDPLLHLRCSIGWLFRQVLGAIDVLLGLASMKIYSLIG
ncbi:hypothetical protein AB0C02_32100 [Micromonospora sp. NPDC048999]|uniref:hypothetical protein n=1 Tax=Micromonospora sp. NPDC048999 TaxID=3155391 RepID=UPI003408D724